MWNAEDIINMKRDHDTFQPTEDKEIRTIGSICKFGKLEKSIQ